MSKAVSRRCAGGNGEFFDPDDSAIDQVLMDVEYSGGAHDTTVELDTTQVFSVHELVNDGMEVVEGAEIRSRDVISFVLMKWDSSVDTNWTVPEPQLFHDLVNRVEDRANELRLKCGDVLKWSSLWGKVGLLGLSIKDRDLLIEFRELVEKQVTGSIKFSIYPRDALEKKGNVSVLLRETYRGLDVKLLPRSIFRRNRALRGGLKVTHIKHYGDAERSRAGASKKGWRLVLLQGDATFMESLERFEPEHRFWVGSDRIIIRGGNRKTPSSKRQSSSDQGGPGPVPAGQQQQQQQHPKRRDPQQHQQPWGGQQQQQQSWGGQRQLPDRHQQQLNASGRGGGSSREHNRTFPNDTSRMSGTGRGRGAGTGSRSGDINRGAPVWGEVPHAHGANN